MFDFEHNLFIQDLATGEIQQITDDGSPNIINGKSDWIYEEEVIASNKMIWWSPSGNHFILQKSMRQRFKRLTWIIIQSKIPI